MEELFIRLEDVILANSGADEFNEILKIITLKLWIELELEKNYLNENKITKETGEKLLKKISESWDGVLVETEILLDNQHFQVCFDLVKNFELINYGVEALDTFFEYIVSRVKKGNKGQYFTPRYIVDFCVRLVNPKSNETIMDPASGSGAFLFHSNNYIVEKNLEKYNNKNFYLGFDYDKDAVRISKLLANISKIKNINIFHLNSLLNPKLQSKSLEDERIGKIVTIEDHLKVIGNKVDVILTNPPFAGEIIEEEILDSYELSIGKKRVERDTLFLERCIKLLDEKGRMAIILPNSKFGNTEFTYLRKWLLERVDIIGVIGLPRSTFMPHTSVKTSILIIQKNTDNVKKLNKIFFGISELSGKDSKGNFIYQEGKIANWMNVKHDLSDIEKEFKIFLEENKIGW